MTQEEANMADYEPNYRELCDRAYEIFQAIDAEGIPLPDDLATWTVGFMEEYLGAEPDEDFEDDDFIHEDED
jgi:hypothetical protein